MNINEHTDFVFSKPKNDFLKSIVETYFYIHIPISELVIKTEYVIPFPRVTFGYFFNHPFRVKNLSKNELRIENCIISKVTKDQIVVEPETEKIKILGAHLKPFTLAYFTNASVRRLDWLVIPFDLLNIEAERFEEQLNESSTISEMFDLMETTFLDALLVKDIQVVRDAVNLIESSNTILSVDELSSLLNITERTLRNHFYKFIGCSPKDYLQIVRIKKAAYEIYNAKGSLTNAGYNADFSDQAHFTNTIKDSIGKTPKNIRKDLPNFRFLQF